MQNGSLIHLINAYRFTDSAWNPLPVSDTQVQQWYEAGLASVAVRSLGKNLDSLPGHSRELLMNAHLTARVVYGQLRDTTIEILGIARTHDIPVVLLKGISVAESIYAKPHDRTMSDVDILVPVEQAERFQGLLTKSGYRQTHGGRATGIRPAHHHLEPLEHPDSGVAVEIHTGLLSTRPVCKETLFQTESAWEQVESSRFHGASCLKLSREMQLMYAVAHWGIDQNWAVHVIGILDIVLMLENGKESLDGDLIERFLVENPLV